MGLNIANNMSVYLDTCILVYTVESHPNYYSLIQPLWQKFQDGNIQIVTSELTLMEVLVFPIKSHPN
jgi:predicted nucleic acid-binding protein